MEGNRFHDPETPPPIDLSSVHPVFSRTISDETISQISNSAMKEFDERIDISNATITSSLEQPSSTVQQRRVSHTDQALHLVDTVTRTNNKRRPSKAGILSNLLKLEIFEEKNRRQQQGSSRSHPPRPTHQLRSIASSRALLQTIGASPQSARSSMYFEDLHKAELGITDDASVAANRMAIAAEIADILQRQDLIIKMGKSLVRTGAPSHRIVKYFFF
jgi:hypothetical protein